MEDIEKTVFISYRRNRTDSPWAQSIFEHLNRHGFDVFIDTKGIASGDFESIIVRNIAARAHFVVVLTPSTLNRCDEPGDWLRREIETAMDNRRNVVPVMLNGFSFGASRVAQQLTGKLETLRGYNGLKVPDGYFEAAMQRLRDEFLNVLLRDVHHPKSAAAQAAAKEPEKAANPAARKGKPPAVLQPGPRSAQRIATKQGKPANATPAVQKKELTPQQWFERGFAATDKDEQVRCYSEAIRLKPDDAQAFNNRGVARVAKGDHDGALQDYSEAIRLKPDFALALRNRGASRGAKGDYGGALQDYSEAIRLKPDDAQAFYYRAVARLKQDLHDTIESFRKPLGTSWDAFHEPDVRRRDKLHLDRLQDLSEAIRLKPDFAEAFNERGSARGAKGDHDGALQDYSEAIRLKADDAGAFYLRGEARQAKGDLDGALQDYTEAIRLKPDDAMAFFSRGNLFEKRSMYREALADFRRYNELSGSGFPLREAALEKKIRNLGKKRWFG